jgi:regulation of enolase protein 1 (concanavalin A-like superfamily)
MLWLHEPPTWRADGRAIIAHAAAKTDFWRKTHDNGVRDNGHFYYKTVSGDFTASVKVSGQYAGLYDQAGIMVRQDETTWLKCGIEFVKGVQYASSVVTRDWSDWAIRPLANPPAIWLRVVRHGGTIEVHVSTDGVVFELIRQAYLSDAPSLCVGIMFCAPTGKGFAVRFDDFVVTATGGR